MFLVKTSVVLIATWPRQYSQDDRDGASRNRDLGTPGIGMIGVWPYTISIWS